MDKLSGCISDLCITDKPYNMANSRNINLTLNDHVNNRTTKSTAGFNPRPVLHDFMIT